MNNRTAAIIDYEDLESEFDYVNEAETSSIGTKRPRIQDDELWKKPRPGEIAPPGRHKARSLFDEERSRIERQKRRLMTLDVYTRHKELINFYYLSYPGATAKLQRDTSRDRTDYDVLKDNHKFLWDEDELAKAAEKSWEARLAKRYYDKLFKEYCIADLSHYKKNKIALRWRIEKEVKSGKGQFECGSKRCSEKESLTSWEVNFAYIEDGVKKNALVKLRLCPDCSKMLNYHSQKRKLEKKDRRKHKKRYYSKSQKEAEDLRPSTPPQDQKESISSEATSQQSEQKDDKESRNDDLMEIWKKPPEDIDPEKIAEKELDEFLDDLLL